MEEVKTNAEVETAVKTEEPKPDYEKLLNDLKAELEKAKSAISKSNSEAAEYKRKLSERLTQEEADRLAQEEREKVIAEQLAEREQLLAEKRTAHYAKMLMGAAIDVETADALSVLLPDGIPDNFFDGIKKFIADLTAKIKADLLNEQPKLTKGMPPASADANKQKDDLLRKAFEL